MTAPHLVEGEGWIEWSGGECPVSPETLVQVTYRDGEGADWCPLPASWWTNHDPTEDAWIGQPVSDADIIAYRVVPA